MLELMTERTHNRVDSFWIALAAIFMVGGFFLETALIVVGGSGISAWLEAMSSQKSKRGISAIWLSCFLRECPAGTVVKGSGKQSGGFVIECPNPDPTKPNETIELARIFNDHRVRLSVAGQALGLPGANDLDEEM